MGMLEPRERKPVANSVGSTSMPSVLAVLRLSTNSNSVVGAIGPRVDSSEPALADGRAVDARGATWAGEPAIGDPRASRRQLALSHSGTPAVVLETSLILGKSVRSNAGEDMGRIVDVIVSRDGQIHTAIIDFGGFLGIGTRKIAVDWNALDFAPLGKPGAIMLELTRDQVRLAPAYKRGEPLVVVSAASVGARAARSKVCKGGDNRSDLGNLKSRTSFFVTSSTSPSGVQPCRLRRRGTDRALLV